MDNERFTESSRVMNLLIWFNLNCGSAVADCQTKNFEVVEDSLLQELAFCLLRMHRWLATFLGGLMYVFNSLCKNKNQFGVISINTLINWKMKTKRKSFLLITKESFEAILPYQQYGSRKTQISHKFPAID